MKQNLIDFLNTHERVKYATQQGSRVHALLQNIVIDDDNGINIGDKDIIDVIRHKPELLPYFCTTAKTEVPIAGILNGVFISRRIDRLLINNQTKTIVFLDYKTDTNKGASWDNYKKQLTEYAQLLRSAYPEHKIFGFILWTQDWCLEQMIFL